MQSIYALESVNVENIKYEPAKMMTEKFSQTRELFSFMVYFLTEVARYAETDARQRASKNIPTEEDLNVSTKIAGNELLWKILESSTYKQMLQSEKPQLIETEGWIKKIYNTLVLSDQYKEYIQQQSRDAKEEANILKFIFTDLMLPNEDFLSFVEEHFPNWDDDADVINQFVFSFLHKPETFHQQEWINADKSEYAKSLLSTVLEKKDYLTDIIKPALQNWDSDRVALLDKILLQMGVAEFLYFETIPTKVTINEYIDIAKSYSTPQSGNFINGILDNVQKELTAQNKINKKDFRQNA